MIPDSQEKSWIDSVVKQDEIDRYLNTDGSDFIDDELIWKDLEEQKNPSDSQIREIISKSLELDRLDPHETAALLNCRKKYLWQEMSEAALEIKQKVYGRRIVIFAPLYISNYCVNNCMYCGFRRENTSIERSCLTEVELRNEIKALIRKGHKRLIMVYGEHPKTGVDFMSETLRIAYDTKEGNGEIRRANINSAPFCISDLKKLHQVGIGTYQVFQETYHRKTYRKVHPPDTLKGNMLWRLYSLHRAQEAEVDDVGIGALYGLFDYRFEVMATLLHTIDLEKKFGGVGPHTISFPRLEPAVGTPFLENPEYRVSDEEFRQIVIVLRLSVPYTGLILTAREPEEIRRKILPLGVTQIDAGSNIGIGGYSSEEIEGKKQQFMLSDIRSLDETISELIDMDMITSFCTAGYRCGRTGDYFMNIAKTGKVHTLCMPNAILTFAEYLTDYALPETRLKGWELIEKETESLPDPDLRLKIKELLNKIRHGERDLYF